MESIGGFESTPDSGGESSKDKRDDRPKRPVALPASALHGVGHEGARTPSLESLLGPPPALQQEMMFQAAKAEHDKADKESDEDDEDDTTPIRPAQDAVLLEEAELPLQHLAQDFELPAPAAPEHAEVTEAEIVPAEVFEAATPAETNKAFQQIVETNLQDLKHLDLEKPWQRELENLNPPVNEIEPTIGPTEGEIPLRPAVPSTERVATTADFAAWEQEMQSENLPPFPAPPSPARPQATTPAFGGPRPWQSPNSMPLNPNQTPPAQGGTGGGGGRPPRPPFGAAVPMPGGPPNPNFNVHAAAANVLPHINPNILTMPNALSTAALLYLNGRVNQLEIARRQGAAIDTLTGVVAGWALFRTVRNRHMIKRNQRETTKQFTEQAAVNTRLEEQNDALRQQLTQTESQHQALASGERPGTPQSPVEQAKAAQAEATEQVRLIHEQQEKALRQQELQAAPGRHIEHSGWHAMEMVDKTGRVARKPKTIEYGQAFHEETEVEQLADDAFGVDSQSAAQGLAGTTQPGPGMTPLPPLSTPGALPGQYPASPSPSEPSTKPAAQQIAELANNPWAWVGVAFLILVFVLAAFL